MSPTRTILRFNLALDRILAAIVQLRASVVSPLCRPPSLRLRVVPPIRRKPRRRRRPRRLRDNHRQVAKAFAFAIDQIYSRQYVVRTFYERVESEHAPLLRAPPLSPSPAPSAASVEFVMDTQPITFATPSPRAIPMSPAPPPLTPPQIRRPTLPAFPPSPPPVPPTRFTQLALARFPNSWPSLPIRSGSPIRTADQSFNPTPFVSNPSRPLPRKTKRKPH